MKGEQYPGCARLRLAETPVWLRWGLADAAQETRGVSGG